MVPSLIYFKGRHLLLRLVRQRGPPLDGEKSGRTCWLDLRDMGRGGQHGERLVDETRCSPRLLRVRGESSLSSESVSESDGLGVRASSAPHPVSVSQTSIARM
jgi:hypothetical protein